jgi:hypothetical protein
MLRTMAPAAAPPVAAPTAAARRLWLKAGGATVACAVLLEFRIAITRFLLVDEVIATILICGTKGKFPEPREGF